jgi:hypothetical protein
MASKHGKEGVAFSAYLAAVALGDRRPQDGVVPFLDCAVLLSKLLQQPGRALLICEQEGDDPGGEVARIHLGRIVRDRPSER